MKRARLAWLGWLGLWALQACAQSATLDNSSGSNWLQCESFADCDDARAVRCRGDGYCVDADGERIAVAAGAADGGVESSPSVPSGSSGPSGASGSMAPASAQTATSGAQAPPVDGSDSVTTGCVSGETVDCAPVPSSVCDAPGAREPLTAVDMETCYAFAVHGTSSPGDTSPFTIMQGEQYNQFYYEVPWPAETVATRYGVVDDSGLSVHAWAFVSPDATQAPGTVEAGAIGTLFGQNPRMIAMWSRGGCNVTLPDDVGLELPSRGKLVVQWHHFNDTVDAVPDRSAFQICTVPAASRAHSAGITALGTENLNGMDGLPPGVSQFGGACVNDSGAPITLVTLSPHMHQIGDRMTSVVERAGGDIEPVFSAPFSFGDAHAYPLSTRVVLQPGDTIRSLCTYDNTTGMRVLYGLSAWQEMCYQFAFAYPSGALDNGVISLFGTTNTCW